MSLGICCVVFTNRIEDLRLQDLAEVDLREVIYQVQEFFGDFAVLDPHHFAIPIQQNHVTLQPFTWDYGRRCPSAFTSPHLHHTLVALLPRIIVVC